MLNANANAMPVSSQLLFGLLLHMVYCILPIPIPIPMP